MEDLVEIETTDGRTRAAIAEIDCGDRSTTFVVATKEALESKSDVPFARFPATPPTAPAINAIPTARPTLTFAPWLRLAPLARPFNGSGNCCAPGGK
jgi:hypothetical protein